ncbi:MAG TPA: rod shape-determining protein RodA [Candidatus Wolfebacteria bacterium]|nr:rod shape-determining protein RodA [Candidatus Wolfebacteria bacterium]
MFSLLKKTDWQLNIAVLFLAAASLTSLISTKPNLFWKQLLWYGIGFLFIFLIIRFDWRAFINYRGAIWGIYFLAILLLILTYFFAPAVRGAKSWLIIGSFQFQTAEFAKLALIIVLASFFSRRHISIARVSNLLISFIYLAIPAGLIAIQPDFGSALIMFFIWFGFLLISGIRWRHLVIAMIIFSILGTVMWQSVLQDYQKERIVGVFFSERDVLGINYSVIQSKIAIGSAGFFGKGFNQGTQIQLGFLPEAQTDFIFAALIEEWGIFGGMLIIAAFMFLILRIITIGMETDNNFNRFLCLGTVVLFGVQFVLNVGSNLGLTPVIGVTFPFLSYGGSSILINLILIGIIQSIATRK